MAACTPPAEIRFERQLSPFWPPTWYVARYTREENATGYIERYKNVERFWRSGPSHAIRCGSAPAGTTTQKVSMKLRTKRFFATNIGDHLAILQRADFYAWPGPSRPPEDFYPLGYSARGIGLHGVTGVWGELFDTAYGLNQPEFYQAPGYPPFLPNPVRMKDDVEYRIEMVSTPYEVSYTVTDSFTGVQAKRIWAEKPYAYNLTGDGFAVALICQGNAQTQTNCDAPSPPPLDASFSVHFYDIKTTAY